MSQNKEATTNKWITPQYLRNLVFQNSCLYSGSDRSVLSIKAFPTLFKRPSWSSLKTNHVNIFAYDLLLFLLYVGNSYSCSIGT